MFHFPLSRENYERHMRRYQDFALEDALKQSELPIGNNIHLRPPTRPGVVLIENIPYTLTRLEVIQFFGRDAPLLPAFQCPVHITMERTSGRTMVCYAEFKDEECARAVVNRFNQILDAESRPRMGNRRVDVSLSSHDALLKELFPMVKCVDWVDGQPVERQKREDEWYSTGFSGLLTDEELFCLTKHARDPQRSVFASKMPSRTYESIMSIIWKFPWQATKMYTVHMRNKLFETLCEMIEVLVDRVENEHVVGLDQRLLGHMVQTGLRCPGFNPRMKVRLVEAGRDQQTLARMSREYLTFFPFDSLTWLGPCYPAPLEFYASIIARANAPGTEFEGLENSHTDPTWIEPYGKNLFAWTKEAAKQKKFADAIDYELRVFRALIARGWGDGRRSDHPRQLAIEAPPPRDDNATPRPRPSAPRGGTHIDSPHPSPPVLPWRANARAMSIIESPSPVIRYPRAPVSSTRHSRSYSTRAEPAPDPPTAFNSPQRPAAPGPYSHRHSSSTPGPTTNFSRFTGRPAPGGGAYLS